MLKLPWKRKTTHTSASSEVEEPSNTKPEDLSPQEKYQQDLERITLAEKKKQKERKKHAGILKTIRRKTYEEPRSFSFVGNPFRDPSATTTPNTEPEAHER